MYDSIEDSHTSDVIHENIVDSIKKASVVIFEISDLNPNVLYELGIAKGLNKQIIMIREDSCREALPTDINSLKYIQYSRDKLFDKSKWKLNYCSYF